MRFGKKFALQTGDDNSGAPYLSFKPMKETINATVRELRQYQARTQAWPDTFRIESSILSDIANHKARIISLDQDLFSIVEDDLKSIYAYIRASDTELLGLASSFQSKCLQAGLMISEKQLEQLAQCLPFALANHAQLGEQAVRLAIEVDTAGMRKTLVELAQINNRFVTEVDKHTQYVEVNVAGFRKLLKRHEKQLPSKFHARPTPFLEFHKLVTHGTQQVIEMAREFARVLADAQQRLQASRTSTGRDDAGANPEVLEPKGLGVECEMVLEIKRQLRVLGAAPAPRLEATDLNLKPGTPAGAPPMTDLSAIVRRRGLPLTQLGGSISPSDNLRAAQLISDPASFAPTKLPDASFFGMGQQPLEMQPAVAQTVRSARLYA